MRSIRTFALLLFVLPAIQQVAAQTALKSPDAFLPQPLGEQFTPHYLLTDYYEYLAANAPTTMKLQRYGKTNENRPLQVAFFSSPENIARLDQIRENNLRLAGIIPGKPDESNPIAIVWLSMSVHGNEPTGSECSLELAYQLATQSDPQIKEWLKNTLVIIDPSLNPDGYDRYTHWYLMASNFLKNPNRDTREHHEPWPGGRPNHYYFDLNRDWAWASQAETRQRLAIYQAWLPQIHADLHEQSVDNPYYFAPAAEPMHDYITPWQRDFQTQIGQNHAKYFDKNGWLYFTKEVFDLFYPSYGDTYPMFNGSIGMTYEQGGNSRAGRSIILAIGDTLTLHDRIAHHLTTSLSTIEMGSNNAAKVVQNFQNYYAKSATQPQGKYKGYVIRATNDPNKVEALCNFLDLHRIQYGRVGAGLSGVRAFDYTAGKDVSASLNPNDLIISSYQPKSTLLQALFEPEAHLTDSLTYDITAWAMPFAYGLDAYALLERVESKKSYEHYQAPTMRLAAAPYSWCVHHGGLQEDKMISELLQKGLRIRYAKKTFAMADQQFEPGSYVINKGENKQAGDQLDKMILDAATRFNVTLHPIFSGFVGKGADFGSDAFEFVRKPEVGLLFGDDVDDNAFGHIWFFMERELGYPLSAIDINDLHRVNLSGLNTIILPDGSYTLTERQITLLRDWVRGGGKLILMERGIKPFAGKDGLDLEQKDDIKKDTSNFLKPYETKERATASEQLPGAIIKSKCDTSHPLGYGLGEVYFTLRTTADVFEMPDKTAPAIYIDDTYQSYGFIGSKVKPRLKKTPVAGVQSLGRGTMVYFVDAPLYRNFWQEGKLLFCNGLFF